MTRSPEVRFAGDAALLMEFGDMPDPKTNRAVHQTARAVTQAAIPGVWGVVPAYTTLLVEFDPGTIGAMALKERLLTLEIDDLAEKPRCFEIPTAYGGEFGLDFDEVAAKLALAPEDLIAEHVRHRYQIYCLGFSPGFPLAGLLPESLRLPRRASPRTQVPPGTVAIAGFQTGVYPSESPGGWHLIGRTPARLFYRDREPPVLYAPGDFLCFRPIDAEEYRHLAEISVQGEWVIREVTDGSY